MIRHQNLASFTAIPVNRNTDIIMGSNRENSDSKRPILDAQEQKVGEANRGGLMVVDPVDLDCEDDRSVQAFVCRLPGDLSWKHVFVMPFVLFSMLFNFMVFAEAASSFNPLTDIVQMAQDKPETNAAFDDTISNQDSDHSMEVVSREGDLVRIRCSDGRIFCLHNSQVQIVFENQQIVTRFSGRANPGSNI